jgi:hypothetical protein
LEDGRARQRSGGLSGAFNAAINGGNTGDVLRGAAIGAIQGGISGSILHGLADGYGFDNAFLHIAGHGVVGGAANEALGGKFQDGFLSAAAGAASTYAKFGNNNIYTRTLKASVVGGTASALGGGKFANGAWTSAFQHLLNHEVEDIFKKFGDEPFEWHHKLPRDIRFSKYWKAVGLDDWEDGKYGVYLSKADHQSVTATYGNDWEEFFKPYNKWGTKPSRQDILENLKILHSHPTGFF